MLNKPNKCTHCGREECRTLGDADCQAAREEYWKDLEKKLEMLAHYSSKPQKEQG